MPSIKTQDLYRALITEEVGIAASGDASFTVTTPPNRTNGFLVLSPDNSISRETVYYHDVIGNRIFIRGVNRKSPKFHPKGDAIQMNDVEEIFNYYADMTSPLFYTEKIGGLNVRVWGGTVLVNRTQVTIADTNLTLTDNATNYIVYDYVTNVVSANTTGVGLVKATAIVVSGLITSITYNTIKESYADPFVPDTSIVAPVIQNNTFAYAESTGSANAYLVSYTPAPTAYVAGQKFFFKANFQNTGSATLNVNGLGPKTIKKLDGATDLASTDIASGAMVEVLYDGVNFQLTSIPQTIISPNIPLLTEKTQINEQDLFLLSDQPAGYINKKIKPTLLTESEYFYGDVGFIENLSTQVIVSGGQGTTTAGVNLGGGAVGQTFKVPDTYSYVTPYQLRIKVSAISGTPFNVNISIYDSPSKTTNFYNSGTINVNSFGTGYLSRDVSSAGLKKGVTYFIEITSVNNPVYGQFGYTSGNPYSDGTMYVNGSISTGNDLDFFIDCYGQNIQTGICEARYGYKLSEENGKLYKYSSGDAEPPVGLVVASSIGFINPGDTTYYGQFTELFGGSMLGARFNHTQTSISAITLRAYKLGTGTFDVMICNVNGDGTINTSTPISTTNINMSVLPLSQSEITLTINTTNITPGVDYAFAIRKSDGDINNKIFIGGEFTQTGAITLAGSYGAPQGIWARQNTISLSNYGLISGTISFTGYAGNASYGVYIRFVQGGNIIYNVDNITSTTPSNYNSTILTIDPSKGDIEIWTSCSYLTGGSFTNISINTSVSTTKRYTSLGGSLVAGYIYNKVISTNTNRIKCYKEGIIPFTGLTTGYKYFFTIDGIVTSSIGSGNKKIGCAISVDKIAIEKYNIIPGATVLASSVGEKNSQDQKDQYIKLKEIRVSDSGKYTVKFSLKGSTSGAGRTAKGRIYRNNVAYGTERLVSSTSYTEFSEDLFFDKGDFVQIYAAANDTNSPTNPMTAYISGFSLSAGVADISYTSSVTLD